MYEINISYLTDSNSHVLVIRRESFICPFFSGLENLSAWIAKAVESHDRSLHERKWVLAATTEIYIMVADRSVSNYARSEIWMYTLSYSKYRSNL